MRLRSETAALLRILHAHTDSLSAAEVAERAGYSIRNAQNRLRTLEANRLAVGEDVRRAGTPRYPFVRVYRITSTGDTALRARRAPRATCTPSKIVNSVWALGSF